MRATARVTGVSDRTVKNLFALAGKACVEFHNQVVRNVRADRVECDEMWAFTYAKDKTLKRGLAKAAPADAGSAWTWTLDSSPVKRESLSLCLSVWPTSRMRSHGVGHLLCRITED